MRENYHKNLCGIDEAGRGPLAGPLVVAGVKFFDDIDTSLLTQLADSKKLTEKKREKLYDIIIKNSEYSIVFSSSKQIDQDGLSLCLHNSIQQIINKIDAKEYLMDGNTTFGVEGVKSLIKADDKIYEVSAASILAKVSRDRYMYDIANLYPNYSFDKHKGYGTKLHKEAIAKYGLCEIHRKSFKIK